MQHRLCVLTHFFHKFNVADESTGKCSKLLPDLKELQGGLGHFWLLPPSASLHAEMQGSMRAHGAHTRAQARLAQS